MSSGESADNAKLALDEARQLAAQGRFAEALEKHVWFHKHALEIRRSYYGVRLSYALRDWVDLGRKYAKAIEVLKAIRDQKASELLQGHLDRELFHDVESINDCLNERAATVDLFKAIEVRQPEFAASIYDLADEALIGAEEYALAGKYLGDASARLESAKADLEWGMECAKTKERAEQMQQAFERIFEDEAVRIITVLARTGRQQLAKETRSYALAIMDSPVIRNVSID
jgi:hypothetical protein